MFKFDQNRIKDGWEKLCTDKQTNKPTDTTKIMVTWPWTKNGFQNKKREMHNVQHASLLTYLYKWIHPRRILPYRYTCSFLECWCIWRKRYNLRCSWHTRRYLHYHGCHAWIWRYWQAKFYLPLSFTPGPKPAFSQIVPTIDSLPASGLTTLTVCCLLYTSDAADE